MGMMGEGERGVREDHGQDAASGAGEGVGDIVVLGYHGLGRGGGHGGCDDGVVMVVGVDVDV